MQSTVSKLRTMQKRDYRMSKVPKRQRFTILLVVSYDRCLHDYLLDDFLLRD